MIAGVIIYAAYEKRIRMFLLLFFVMFRSNVFSCESNFQIIEVTDDKKNLGQT